MEVRCSRCRQDRRPGWSVSGCRKISRFADKYRDDLGNTAYALVNAATDYASDANAPLMSPARVDALQARCGRWVDRTLERYGSVLTSRPVVEVSEESRNAARRLAAIESSET